MKSEDVEFVSNILVVADQFLLNRLKEICECQVSFVDILTTRCHWLLSISVESVADTEECCWTIPVFCLLSLLPAPAEQHAVHLSQSSCSAGEQNSGDSWRRFLGQVGSLLQKLQPRVQEQETDSASGLSSQWEHWDGVLGQSNNFGRAKSCWRNGEIKLKVQEKTNKFWRKGNFKDFWI